jgi:hypothetical protein
VTRTRQASQLWFAALALLGLAALGCRTAPVPGEPGPAPDRPDMVDARRADRPPAPVPEPAADADPGEALTDASPAADAARGDPALIGHWKLDEQAGTVASDSSGRNNAAMLVNVPAAGSWVLGRLGGAIALPGGNAHLRAASSVSLNGIFRAVTIAAWVLRPSGAAAAGRATVLSRQGAYLLGFEGEAPRLALTVDARPTPVVVQAAEAAARGRWVHLAGTFDGSQVRLFVEGREVAEVAFSGTIGSSTVPLTLGARLAAMPDEPLAGRLDDVRLYARALSATEIAALAAP